MAFPEIFQALVCLVAVVVLLTCPGTNGYRCPPVRDADCTRETCQILSGEFKYGGRSWTGFCSRNRSFFFSKWKCRGKEFDPAKAGTYLLKVGQTCRLRSSSSSSSSEGFHRWELPCLERYNWKRCDGRRSSRENSTTSECLRVKSNYVSIRAEKDGGGERVISKRHYSRSRFSFPVSTEAYFPIDSLNNKNDSSMGKRRFSSRKIHISKRRIPRQSTAASLAKKTKTKKSESFGKRAISGERDNSPRSKQQASHLMPCKENEKFYNNSCYYFTTYRLMDPPDEGEFYGIVVVAAAATNRLAVSTIATSFKLSIYTISDPSTSIPNFGSPQGQLTLHPERGGDTFKTRLTKLPPPHR